MRNPVDNYFEWLLMRIDFDEQPIYWKAIDILFRRQFIPIVYRDENRVMDGAALREAYFNESGEWIPEQDLVEGCSIFEMMVALAERIEYDNMHDEDLGDRTPLWFWRMFESLGLDRFSDYQFDEEAINDIVDIFLERRYDRQGHGSLFTINNPSIDMRNTEVWYQAQFWLEENYY